VDDPPPDVIARFVGQLASADVALVVLTPEYVGDPEARTMRRWIFEEWMRIAAIRTLGLLEIVCVLLEGPPRSHGVTPHNTLDLVIDLRGREDDDRRPVLDFFGSYRGPLVSDVASARLAQAANACIEASRAHDRAKASAELGRIEDLRKTEEYRVADVSYRAMFGTREDAVRATLDVLTTNPSLPAAAEWP
jgi:hypothetical protein